MPLTDTTPDPAALAELGRRLARQRLDRNLSQDDLAREAGVSKRTLHRMEHGHSAQMTNWIRVLRALGLLALGLGALWLGLLYAPLHHSRVPHAVIMTAGGVLVALAHLLNLRLNHGHVHGPGCAH